MPDPLETIRPPPAPPALPRFRIRSRSSSKSTMDLPFEHFFADFKAFDVFRVRQYTNV